MKLLGSLFVVFQATHVLAFDISSPKGSFLIHNYACNHILLLECPRLHSLTKSNPTSAYSKNRCLRCTDRSRHRLQMSTSESEKENPDNSSPKSSIPIVKIDDEKTSDLSLSIKSSLSTLISNVSEGDLGKRGESYVLAQLLLVICIALGFVPVFNGVIQFILGPGFIFSGSAIIFFGVKDMFFSGTLSPYSVPVQKGRLLNGGIAFSELRHPIYAGLLYLTFGLSFITQSVTRLVLTICLYALLDRKSSFEEEELMKIYKEEYVDYKAEVQGKFVPKSILSVFNKMKADEIGINNSTSKEE